jgi:hypothetical protein
MELVSNYNFEQFLNGFLDLHEPPILVPIFVDTKKHPLANVLCFLGVYFVKDQKQYGLPFAHSEVPHNLEFSRLDEMKKQTIVCVPDIKKLPAVLNFENVHEIESLEYLSTGNVTPEGNFYPSIVRDMHYKFSDNHQVNNAVPIYKLMEFCRDYSEHLVEVIKNGKEFVALPETSDWEARHRPVKDPYRFFNLVAKTALREVEAAGLKVDPLLFKRHFNVRDSRLMEDNFVYSQYNLYTTTGRPSCKFGGVNFAAINKSDGSRKAFISRFKDGKLILVDYEAFHLRLIADLIKYDLPKTSVHEHFGQQYFSCEQLTKEQYEDSKKKTFQQLYGDTDSEIPFFQKVNEYQDRLWKEINEVGYLLSPYYSRKIYLDRIWEPTPAKVFNYLIQLYETEYNMWTLSNVVEILRDKKSKVILYNYDSFLIDMCPDDGDKVVEELLEEISISPIRVYIGKNYHDLQQLE